jgi:hypothetical protein
MSEYHEDWEQAFQVAEETGFDPVESLEHEDGGHLAQHIANLYTDELIGQDEGKLWAAIQVAGQVWASWDAPLFESVLKSYDGEKQNDTKLLVEEYLNENHDSYPLSEVRDVDYFFKVYVLGENSLCGEDQPNGQTLHFFKRGLF